MKISVRGQELILAKERAVYFSSQKLLAISDLHLGKAAHFRKAGVPVPTNVSQSDLLRLQKLIDEYEPETLLINGDMFHSDYNKEIDDFASWKAAFKGLNFLLVKGNHDRQSDRVYQSLGITLHEPTYCTDQFCFVHDALKCNEEQLYPVSGHVHPGISIFNNAKQRLKFPCFYFGQDFAILPAFSAFTGLYMVKAGQNDRVFAITPNKVIDL